MPEQHSLSFADVTIVKPNIAEVVVSEGVEIHMDMVREYHEFLLTHMQAPFGLLINKKYPYTYTFEAQLSIGLLKEIDAVAVVAYNNASRVATETLKHMPNHTQWNMETFSDYDEAMGWLEQQLESAA